MKMGSITFDWVRLVRKSNTIELSHTNFRVQFYSIMGLIEPNRLISKVGHADVVDALVGNSRV